MFVKVMNKVGEIIHLELRPVKDYLSLSFFFYVNNNDITFLILIFYMLIAIVYMSWSVSCDFAELINYSFIYLICRFLVIFPCRYTCQFFELVNLYPSSNLGSFQPLYFENSFSPSLSTLMTQRSDYLLLLSLKLCLFSFFSV